MIDGQNHYSLAKQLTYAKNNNEKLKIQLNNYTAEIKSLRTKIDELRKERIILDTQYSKFEKTIRDRINKYLKLLEHSTGLEKRKRAILDSMKTIDQAVKQNRVDLENRKFLFITKILKKLLKL